MDKQALNQKIAEWCGFKFVSFKNCERSTQEDKNKHGDSLCHVEAPDGVITDAPPDFTSSLDALFKWAVPKLQLEGLVISLIAYEYSGFGCLITPFLAQEPLIERRNSESPALAFCLALEKLIDSNSGGTLDA
jgi:hypothetical protein